MAHAAGMTVGGLSGGVAVAALLALVGAGPATAQGPSGQAPPVLTPAQASEQLEQVIEALTEPGEAGEAGEPGDLTIELRDLALALPALEGAERRRAKVILARPSDGKQVEGAPGWTQAEIDSRDFHDSPGGEFRIHYVTTGTGNSPPLADTTGEVGVPDYVELVAQYADESWSVQNDDLGWPPPKNDGARGDTEVGEPASGRTDIYLSDLAGSGGVLFGYAAAEGPAGKCFRPPFRCFAYLVLDNDYAEPGYGYGGVPDVPLSATMAHEYNHVLQFRLDAIQDAWMFESTATWAEEKTFPDADDWIVTFMPVWARAPHRPIASAAAPRYYGTAVWNHWLELGAGYGPEAILDAWRQSRKSKPRHFAPGAYHRAINRAGGRGLPREFGRFAAATAEWRVTGSGFPADDLAELPNVRRQGTLRRGARAKRFELDHTAYRLLRTKPHGRGRLRLRVRAPRGVRTMIALVGRKGGPQTGKVTARHGYLHRGGRGSVRLRKARRFERVTAVIANADARVRGFGGFDWRFTRDNARYRAALR